MLLLQGLVIVSYLVYFVFITLCLACGLYYLAEFVEEYTVFTKRLIRNATIAIIVAHVLMVLLEEFPLWNVLLGLAAHVVYLTLLKRFPVIEASDPKFILSCVMAIGDHCAWFYYFTTVYYPFSQILALFFLCVWLIPFAYFISLSANDNALPSGGGSGGSGGNLITSTGAREDAGEKHKKHSGWLLSLFGFLRTKQDKMLPDMLGAPTNIKLT